MMLNLITSLLVFAGAPHGDDPPRFPARPYSWPGPVTPDELLPFDSTETAAFARLGVTRIESRRSDLPDRYVAFTLNKAGQAILEEGVEQKGRRTHQTYKQTFSYDPAGRLLSRVLHEHGRLDSYDSLRYDDQGRIVWYDWWLSDGRKRSRPRSDGQGNRTILEWRPDGSGRSCDGWWAPETVHDRDTVFMENQLLPYCAALKTDGSGRLVLIERPARIDSLAADVVTDTAVIRRTWFRYTLEGTPTLGREVVIKHGRLHSMTIYDEDQPGAVSWRRDYTYDEQGRLMMTQEGNRTITTMYTYGWSDLKATAVRVDPTTVTVTRYTYSFDRQGW